MGRVFDCVVSQAGHGLVPAGVCWLEEAPRRGEVLVLHTPAAEIGQGAFTPLPARYLVEQVERHAWDSRGLTAVHEGPLPRDTIYLRPLGDDGRPVLREPGPVPGRLFPEWVAQEAGRGEGGQGEGGQGEGGAS